MSEDKTLAMPMNGGDKQDVTKHLTQSPAEATSTNSATISDATPVVAASNKFFFIKGKKYDVKTNLSETSGEAQVFLVENEARR
ncbi:MAG: hypothetical protein IKR18_06395 [Bacteroidaceae bacterium]|nr:hypothetical protein [Bacteroidaceae bacterium]